MSKVNLETFAGGGKWKSEAMNNVKEYLKKELVGIEGFTVIS